MPTSEPGAAAVRAAGLSVWRDRAERSAPPVLQGLSFGIGRGERVALVGPNGAGKTTLLLALVGAAPFEGTLEVGGLALSARSLKRVRAQVGYVFADPGDQLFLERVADEVAFGPAQRGVQGAELTARVDKALTAVGLSGYEKRAGGQLSLGEQRRLALATVLSIEPGLILLDEPTASLDPRARRQVVRTIAAAVGSTVVFATHDLEAALELECRVLVVGAGRVLADGDASQVLSDEALLHRAQLELPLRFSLGRSGAGAAQPEETPECRCSAAARRGVPPEPALRRSAPLAGAQAGKRSDDTRQGS